MFGFGGNSRDAILAASIDATGAEAGARKFDAASEQMAKSGERAAKRAGAAWTVTAGILAQVGAGLAIRAGIQAVSRAGSELEQVAVRLRNSLGEVGGAMGLEFVEGLGNRIPASLRERADAMADFSNRGLIPTSRDMIFFSDVAENFNLTFGEVTKAITSGSNEREMALRRLGVAVKEVEGVLTLQSLGTGATATAQSGNLRSVVEALQKVLGSQVAGSSARQMETLAEATDDLGEAMKRAGAKMASSGLNEGLGRTSRALADILDKSGGFTAIGAGLGTIANSIAMIAEAVARFPGGPQLLMALLQIGASAATGAAVGLRLGLGGAGVGALAGGALGVGLVAGNAIDRRFFQPDTDLLAGGVAEKGAAQREKMLRDRLAGMGGAGGGDAAADAWKKAKEQLDKYWEAFERQVQADRDYQQSAMDEEQADRVAAALDRMKQADEANKKWTASVMTYGDAMTATWEGATDAIVDFRRTGIQSLADFGNAFVDMMLKIAAQQALSPLFNGIAGLFPGAAIPIGGAAASAAPSGGATMGVTVNNYAANNGISVQPRMSGGGLTLDVLVAPLEARMMERAARGTGLHPMIRQATSGGGY